MSYRDPNEALRAENESLQRQLREAQEEVASLRGGAPDADPDGDRRRWVMGMRCLGGVALMLPFLLMTAMCEHRVVPRHHAAWMHPSMSAMSVGMPAGQPLVAPHPYVTHTCQSRAAASLGFEGFTQSIERSARVAQSTYGAFEAGASCTVRVVPVTMQDFNCHVEVVCSGQTVYGALPTGYAHCDVDRSMGVTRASDSDVTASDGDPAIHVDLVGHRAVLSDVRDGAPWRLVLALDAAPAFSDLQ